MAARTALRSPSRRSVQLREAKRAQRARERAAGLVTCQLVVRPALADRLRAAVRIPAVHASLDRWLDAHVVDASAWPVLAALCWNRAERWVAGTDALQIYERNWRHVETLGLAADERALVDLLVRTHGGGVLHV